MRAIVATSRTPDVLRELGVRLKTLRLQQNLRVKDLAADSGVGPRTIDRLEAGHSVGTENLVRVMRGLGRLPGLRSIGAGPRGVPIRHREAQGKGPPTASRRADD